MVREVVVRHENDAYDHGFSDAADACLSVVDRRKRELEERMEAGTLPNHDQALVPALTKLRDAMLNELREFEQSQHGKDMAFDGDHPSSS